MKRALHVACAWTVCHTLAFADCKSEVDAAFTKLRAAKSFRLTTKIINPQGTLNMKVDYILPDRMHQRVRLGESPAEMETIAVGEKVWSNQGQGWAEVPKNFADEIVKQIKLTVAEPPQGKVEYKCLGDKAFEDNTYTAYEATLPAPEQVNGAPPAKANVQTLYVDKATGLPARNVVAASDTPDQRLFDGAFSTPSDIEIKEPSLEKPVPNQ